MKEAILEDACCSAGGGLKYFDMSYKRLYKHGKNALTAQSDNTFYKPYKVRYSEVLEIWRYTCSIATREFEPEDLGVISIKEVLQGIKEDFSALRMEFHQRKA